MEFYKSKNFDRRKPRNDFTRTEKSFRSFRNSRDDRKNESATVTCADCGTECQIPFVPKTDKPVTVVIVSDKTKHKIQEMMDIPEMTGVQDIPEMTGVQDIPEMTGVQDIPEMTGVQDIPEMTGVQDIPEMTGVQDIPEMTEKMNLQP